eukprot:3933777-Rhodomonas_salina.1
MRSTARPVPAMPQGARRYAMRGGVLSGAMVLQAHTGGCQCKPPPPSLPPRYQPLAAYAPAMRCP